MKTLRQLNVEVLGRFRFLRTAKMGVATIAGRSTCNFGRSIFRTRRVAANFSVRCQSRNLPAPSPSRLLRRELTTLLPVHTAISTACLVSKLPTEATSSIQGRFGNYLSPI